jgi:glycosyltransferase involved in cell wall biosynthesis
VLQQEGVGWVVAPGDADGEVRAVLEALANRARLEEMGRRAREVVAPKYSFDQALASYCQMIESVGTEARQQRVRQGSERAGAREGMEAAVK